MPIHDWTRVSPGVFHTFRQDWTVEIRRTLNRGLLPPGYSALIDLRVEECEAARLESEVAAYARKANRIAVCHELGPVAAVIEIVSPGNKDSAHAIRAFKTKAVEFLRGGVNLVVIDLFPPTPRDPDGVHQAIWAELTDEPFEARPADKPLTVAAYNAGIDLTAYVDPVAVGDALPDAPLFLAPGRYVNIPLEATYLASWAEAPRLIRDLVEPPTA